MAGPIIGGPGREGEGGEGGGACGATKDKKGGRGEGWGQEQGLPKVRASYYL